jgi:hypothetical protein
MKSSIPGSTAYGYRGTTPYTHGGYSFTPDDIRFLRPLESTVFDWSVEALADGCSAPWTARAQAAARTSRAETWLGRGERIDTCAAERMSTRETWHNLDHQTAMFRRGDELLTVAASRIPQTFESLNQLRGSLALGRVADLSVRHARGLFDSIRNFRATITTEARDYLVSIEVIGQRDIGRARFGARLQPLIGGFGISDVALVESRFERDSLPLELALLPAARLSLSEQIGVYLEVYGIEKGEPLTIALAAEDTRASTFERIGQFFRIIPREKPVEIEWQDRHAGNMSIKRVFFSFPAAELGRGERRLRVTVRRPNGGRASAARVLTVY